MDGVINDLKHFEEDQNGVEGVGDGVVFEDLVVQVEHAVLEGLLLVALERLHKDHFLF